MAVADGGGPWLDELEEQAWRGLVVATSRLLARLDTDLQEHEKLRLADYVVLATLAEAPDLRMRMSELAERTTLSPSGLTRRVDVLERAGLVERVQCPEDRRGTFAALTGEGRWRFEGASPRHLSLVRALFAERLTRQQLTTVSDVADAVLDGLAAAAPLLPAGDR